MEKQIDNSWYSVDEFESSCNEEAYKKLQEQVTAKIEPSETNTIKMTMNLGAVFDIMPVNGLSSGTYRIAVPFECEGKIDYAISAPFNIGYVY